MEFSSNKPIYRQIADIGLNRVIDGAWSPGGRVPSVRELAVELAVNSHTVLKAFEYLEANGIIYSRRGLGYFLSDDALERVMTLKRDEFYNVTLTALFADMDRLSIPVEEVVREFRRSRNCHSCDSSSIVSTGEGDLNT